MDFQRLAGPRNVSVSYKPYLVCSEHNYVAISPIKWYVKIIRKCGSTLYVGLQHAVPPTNTKFKPLLLRIQVGISYTNTHKHRTLYFKSASQTGLPLKIVAWSTNWALVNVLPPFLIILVAA